VQYLKIKNKIFIRQGVTFSRKKTFHDSKKIIMKIV